MPDVSKSGGSFTATARLISGASYSSLNGQSDPLDAEEFDPPANKKSSNSVYSEWMKKNAQQVGLYCATVLIFLLILTLIAFSVYVCVIAAPAIAAGLSLALGLTAIAHTVALAVAWLPVIVMATVLFKFLSINWEMYQEIKNNTYVDPPIDVLRTLLSKPARYAYGLFTGLFIIHKKAGDEIASKESKKFMAIAMMCAFCMGIYLNIYLLPFVFSAVLSLGVSSFIAGLFCGVVLTALFIMPYQLFGFFVRIKLLNQMIHQGLLLDNNSRWDRLIRIAQIAIAAVGLAVTVGLSCLLFPIIVQTLLPVLSLGMATFTAVTICFSLGLFLIMLLLDFVELAGMKISDGPKQQEGDKTTNAIKPQPLSAAALASAEASDSNKCELDVKGADLTPSTFSSSAISRSSSIRAASDQSTDDSLVDDGPEMTDEPLIDPNVSVPALPISSSVLASALVCADDSKRMTSFNS